jgi:hypothetical protein
LLLLQEKLVKTSAATAHAPGEFVWQTQTLDFIDILLPN